MPTQHFERDGFTVVPDVLEVSTCRRLADDLATLESSGVGMRNLLGLGWCQDLARRLRSTIELAAFLSEDSVATQCTAFLKGPGANWLVPLHQDLSIPVRKRVPNAKCRGWSEKDGLLFVQPPTSVLESLVAVRVHLDTCPPESGALKVVPGSHMSGRLVASDAARLRADLSERVVAVPRGGALLMRPLLLHASSKASLPLARRVLHFVFGPRHLPHELEWQAAI